MGNNNKLGQEPAFPLHEELMGNFGSYRQSTYGISKRLYIACIALQGILANENGFITTSGKTSENVKNKVEFAFICADEVLKQKNI